MKKQQSLFSVQLNEFYSFCKELSFDAWKALNLKFYLKKIWNFILVIFRYLKSMLLPVSGTVALVTLIHLICSWITPNYLVQNVPVGILVGSLSVLNVLIVSCAVVVFLMATISLLIEDNWWSLYVKTGQLFYDENGKIIFDYDQIKKILYN